MHLRPIDEFNGIDFLKAHGFILSLLHFQSVPAALPKSFFYYQWRGAASLF